MNRYFINIKIDREERPDLDHIYMDAVQAISGSGGWPLNVFLTPEGKPFFGGTYFPPVPVQNRASWKSILVNIATAFRDKRKDIEEQADHLTSHIARSSFGMPATTGDDIFNEEEISVVFENLMKTADSVDGGFGGAPKFPQTFSIRFLLQYHFYTGNKAALEQACFSLDKMIQGGIYDQVGGGFARYSTDSEWLAPHFEKMLYDNALLVIALSEAFQQTGNPEYERVIRETIAFVRRELMTEDGAFFSALDADSEGEEGKFYVWNKNEIREVLGADSDAFYEYFDVSENGNWEGRNILRIKHPDKKPEPGKLETWKEKMLAARSRRTRPQLDDKILLGWNALMITACCKAFSALGDEQYRDLALQCMNFVETNMRGEGMYRYYHACKKDGVPGRSFIPAFLDDYAYLIESQIHLQEITGDFGWLEKARSGTDWVINWFSEEDSGYFYYTHAEQDDLIIRKREVYDGALPSGNSVMAANLLYLGTVFDLADWKERAARNTGGLKDLIRRYPGSFGVWATVLNGLTYQLFEIILAGSFSEKKHREFLHRLIPNRVFLLTSAPNFELPILRNKPADGLPLFFLCRNYTCQHPVREVAELIVLIKNS